MVLPGILKRIKNNEIKENIEIDIVGGFSSLSLLRGPAPPPPFPLVVPWTIYILGPYFNVAVDVIGPKTDFTLETNRKK